MTKEDKLNVIQNLMKDWDEKRRVGMVDIVKVILSISSVMLTVLVTMEASNKQVSQVFGHGCTVLLTIASSLFLLLYLNLTFHFSFSYNN